MNNEETKIAKDDYYAEQLLMMMISYSKRRFSILPLSYSLIFIKRLLKSSNSFGFNISILSWNISYK